MKRTIKNKDGSIQSAEVRMHHIMRSAAEKVHGAFREFHRDSSAITTSELYEMVRLANIEALESIFDVIKGCDDFDNFSSGWRMLTG